MTEQEILQKAIRKAYKNNYCIEDISQENLEEFLYDMNFYDMFDNSGYYEILFSPEFGKALWGEPDWYYGWFVNKPHGGEWKYVESGDKAVYWGGTPSESPNIVFVIPAWQYHQHKMLDEIQAGRSPILYLKEFI